MSLGCQPPRTRTRYQPSASSNLIISPTFDGMRVPKQTGRTIMRYGCGGGSGCWRRNREDRCSVTCVGLPTVMEVLGHSTYRLTMDTLRGAPPRSLGPGRLSRHGGGVFTGVRSPLRSDAVGVLDADDAAWTPTGLRSSAMPPGGVTRAGCVRQAGHGVRCPDVLTSHIWLPWAPAPWVLA